MKKTPIDWVERVTCTAAVVSNGCTFTRSTRCCSFVVGTDTMCTLEYFIISDCRPAIRCMTNVAVFHFGLCSSGLLSRSQWLK